MAAAYDLVIRNGTVVDGSGSDARRADVAIAGDRIVEVGRVAGAGRDEIDAGGALVTPGFVDIHTHYDGQVSWTPRLAPSSLHGVTTVVFGNCGVGFAPCRPHERELLIKVMEGVEDIPEVVLSEGVQWDWESFPEYLDALAGKQCDIDFAAQVPHGPVRIYAMGRRGADREPATSADLALMTRIVREGVAAGALGFSTSRTLIHRLRDGRLAPTISAGEEELAAIACGLGEIGKGVLQAVDEWADTDLEFDMWERIVAKSGRPFSFSLNQRGALDTSWLKLLERMRAANAAGMTVRGQIICRPIGALLGLDVSFNPFSMCPSFGAYDGLGLAEKVRELKRPEVRARLLAETPSDRNPQMVALTRNVANLFPFGDPPDYAPSPDESIAAVAAQRGVPALELAYDLLLENDGRGLFYTPVSNFGSDRLENVLTMLRHPDTILGIGDGGAHCGMISDASATTYMLMYWTRDRAGERLSIPDAVRKLTRDTAEAIGLADRGILAPGYKADVNVIDYDRLHLYAPHMVSDLPGGGRRLMQQADGYRATVVSGKVTYRDGAATDELPGRLIRGAQPAPNVKSRA